jgi:hypothetical protein
MHDYTNGAAQVKLISQLIQQPIHQVIWDVNAFYFNTSKTTIKLECLADNPEEAAHDYDEICYTRIFNLNKTLTFKEASKWAFKIVATDIRISKIEVLPTFIKFPESITAKEEKEFESNFGLNKIDLGLAIYIDNLFLPAYLLPNNFGFVWLNEKRLYKKEELNFDQNVNVFDIPFR